MAQQGRKKGRPMRQKTSSLTNLIMGMVAGTIFLLGLLTFAFVLTSDPNGKPSIFAAKPAPTGIHQDIPKMPERDFVANPLSLDEKAEMAALLPASFGDLGDGWHLRPFVLQDVYDLRPDKELCRARYDGSVACDLKAGRDDGNLWTYARGDELIVVSIKYWRNHRILPRGEIKSTPSPKVHTTNQMFLRPKSSGPWANVGTRNGFELLKGNSTLSTGTETHILSRYSTSVKGDGSIRIKVASNVAAETTLSVFKAMDRRLIDALLARPVIHGEDAIAAIEGRQSGFEILSDADLRIKVAEMSVRDRNSYAKGLMKSALSKGRRPADYAITYFEAGQKGHDDTVKFLAGRLSKGHPGFKVLNAEQGRNLPVGTCLQTPHAVYCGKQAEYLRIVHEIRRRNHAKAEIAD